MCPCCTNRPKWSFPSHGRILVAATVHGILLQLRKGDSLPPLDSFAVVLESRYSHPPWPWPRLSPKLMPRVHWSGLPHVRGVQRQNHLRVAFCVQCREAAVVALGGRVLPSPTQRP